MKSEQVDHGNQESTQRKSNALTEIELRDSRLTHTRFMAVLSRPDVVIHTVQVNYNSYGEYLFVTISARMGDEHPVLTFFGLGYHEHRERWITQYWDFYTSILKPQKLSVMQHNEAMQLIEDRERYVHAQNIPTQSKNAQLYDVLADLTDDDAALAELDDLGWPLLGFNDNE